jgi:multicomponent Na+:H+ antiporter subunit D
VLFLLPALSLAGVPPFSGFAAKFGLFDATARSHEWTILAVAVLVSLLTLFSLFKIWIAVFWSPREVDDGIADAATSGSPGTTTMTLEAAPVTRTTTPTLMLVPTAVLAAMTLGIGVFAGPLYGLAERAAHDLVDPTPYRTAVLGEGT